MDGLAKVGFKTNLGGDDAGLVQLLYTRAGGYYIGKSTKMVVDVRVLTLLFW